MLELNPDVVRDVIQGARAFHAQEEVSIPHDGGDGDDDWAMQVLASHQGDPTYQRVVDAVADLEPDQQVSLVALMWVGRGDFAGEEWDDAIEQAQDAWNGRVAEYLLSNPLVADYLEEGLAELGYPGDDEE